MTEHTPGGEGHSRGVRALNLKTLLDDHLASAVWAGMSVLFFAIMIWLVTLVYGATDAPEGAPVDSTTNMATQKLALYVVKAGNSTPEATTASYQAKDGDRIAKLLIQLPPGQYYLVLGGIGTAGDCTAPDRMEAIGNVPGREIVDDATDSWWQFNIPYSAVTRSVVCTVRSVLRRPSFAHRSVNVGAVDLTTDDPYSQMGQASMALQQAGAVPVSAIDINFHSEEGADYHFTGGHTPEARIVPNTKTPDTEESIRSLHSTDYIPLEASWTDAAAEDQKEILLIVIGVLIAFGVAMLIEAIRPFVDRKEAAA